MFRILLIAVFFCPIFSHAQIDKSFELNGLIGLQTLKPASMNSLAQEMNQLSGTTKSISEFSTGVMMYGEFLWLPIEMFAIGVRYSITGQSIEGERTTGKTKLGMVMGDLSLVARIQTAPERFQFGLGATLGTGNPMGVVIDTGPSTETAFSASGTVVTRAYGTVRVNFGKFALFADAGYQSAKASQVKNGDVTLTLANGDPVEVDMSGPYFGIGAAAQF